MIDFKPSARRVWRTTLLRLTIKYLVGTAKKKLWPMLGIGAKVHLDRSRYISTDDAGSITWKPILNNLSFGTPSDWLTSDCVRQQSGIPSSCTDESAYYLIPIVFLRGSNAR